MPLRKGSFLTQQLIGVAVHTQFEPWFEQFSSSTTWRERGLRGFGAVSAHFREDLISLLVSCTVKSAMSLFQWMNGWKLKDRSRKDEMTWSLSFSLCHKSYIKSSDLKVLDIFST